MEPESGPLEDDFPLRTTQWFSGSMLIFPGVYIIEKVL